MDLHQWPGNKDNPIHALGTLALRIKHPVLIAQDVAQLFLSHAERVVSEAPKDEPPLTLLDDRGFTRVKQMVEPYLDALPSLGDYELALFQHPPEIYVPVLFLEMTTTEGYQNWDAIRLLADGEYSTAVLPEVERTLRSVRFTGYEHSKCVAIGESVLGTDFDHWYQKTRGRALNEDIELMQSARDSARKFE